MPVLRTPLLLISTLFVSLLKPLPGAGPISFGIKGGVPLNQAFDVSDNRYSVDTQRWTIGPTIEFRFPAGFAAGADALYRRIGSSSARSVGAASFFSDSATSHWEVPVFLKYALRQVPFRPFVAGGINLEHADTSGRYGCSGDPQLCSGPGISASTHSTGSGWGLLAEAGVQLSFGRLTIAPEFRYNRWINGYFTKAFPDSGYPFGIQNQAEILVGLRFQ